MGRLTALVLARPLRAALLLAATTAVLAPGLAGVRTEFGYRPLLGSDHPEIAGLERFIERFGGGLPVWIVWRCEAAAPCRHALSPASLAMAARVEEALLASADVREVWGPAGATILVPTEDGFAVRRLVEDGSRVTDDPVLRKRALADPLWRGRLVSGDGRTGAIVVQPVDAESATSERLVATIFTALAPFEQAGYAFHLVGHAVEFAVAGRELAASSALLTPVAVAVVAAVLGALTRSLLAVLATLATLGLALLWTFGALGWLGWPQDAVLQALAPLVVVVGVCDAIHLLSRARAERAARGGRADRRGALARAARTVARPCVVTSATTGAAFLSFATSDLATFVRFGLIASFSVGACLLLTFTALPLLLWVLPAGKTPGTRQTAWPAVLGALADTASRHRKAVLVATALATIACGTAWATALRVDTDGTEMYGEGSRVVRWIRFVERHLARADTLEVEIALAPGVRIEDPAFLGGVAALGRRLEALPGLGRASSLLDPLARVRRVLHGDDPGQERPAATGPGNAELIELLAFEDPQGLERWLAFDRRTTRVSVEASFQSAAAREQVLAAARRAADATLPPGSEVRLTGPYAVGHAWVRDVQATQLRSFATAMVLVVAIVGIHLRSLRWGLIALVPTVLPAVVVLGAMAILGMSLDVGRAMIAAVLIGIGVDDTIHLLDRYRELRRRGEPPRRAVRAAVVWTGRALVTTSVALSLGFLSLMISSWQTVSSFGFLVALGITLALLADLIVLPALLSCGVDGDGEAAGA